jgi:hypothetical protein
MSFASSGDFGQQELVLGRMRRQQVRESARLAARALLHSALARLKSDDELNDWLRDIRIAWAKAHFHPEQSDRTI